MGAVFPEVRLQRGWFSVANLVAFATWKLQNDEMATILLFRGSSNRLLHPRRMSQQRLGVSLIELIVVLFIIGLMMSFLLLALQSARAKAASTACQNNVRQVGFALSRFIEAKKRFPLPH